jgi:hypothetical protein
LRGDVILARDGDMGLDVDVYFDDERWNVRYFVGRYRARDAGAPSADRPRRAGVGPAQRQAHSRRLPRNEVERSPDVKTALPVALQFDLPQQRRAAADPHLRSSELVIGYQVQALDGPAGHVRDFVVDDATWAVERLVVDTGWFGSCVLISPSSVRGIDWPWRTVHVGLGREAVRRSPRA